MYRIGFLLPIDTLGVLASPSVTKVSLTMHHRGVSHTTQGSMSAQVGPDCDTVVRYPVVVVLTDDVFPPHFPTLMAVIP